MNNEPETKQVPVTIITGFLGSGKTTFLNYVLSEKHGKKIAVIENEFGQEIQIEGAMMIKDENLQQQWIELPNGCVCCAVKDDLLMAVENLVKKKQLDYIFIEPSGLADPGNLASIFWVDTELESEVYLDGIVTVVDAKHVLQHLNEVKPDGVINEAERQIAFADRIIVNKKDLVSENELKEVQHRIRDVNKISPVIVTERSKVPLDEILDIKSFDAQRAQELDPHLFECGDDHHHEDETHDHHHPIHDTSIKTVFLLEKGGVDLSEFHSWLGELLWQENGPVQIFRCKGQLVVEGDNEKHLLQGVHTIFEVEPSGVEWKEDEEKMNRLLFIGRGIEEKSLTESFRTLIKTQKD